MKPVYGIPGMGIMERQVPLNEKCQGCFHYKSTEWPSGRCEVGLYPTHCGEGADPMMSYAPVVLGKIPGVVAPGPQLEAEPLDDAQMGLLKSLIGEVEAESRKYCMVHRNSAPTFFGPILPRGDYAASCSCATAQPWQVTKSFAEKLPNKVKYGRTMAEIEDFVKRAMESVLGTPGEEKKPPKVYLPGVHDPKSPVRPKIGVPKKMGVPTTRAKSDSGDEIQKAEEGISAIEDLLGG